MNKEDESVQGVSCIIPFWNEGKRLFTVLNEVVKVKEFAEIICIDDASYEDNSEAINNKYPSIRLIRLDKNVGKSGAILEGLKKTQSDFILLLDADLRNLNHYEMSEAVRAVMKNPHIDMLVLRRINAPFLVKIFRGDVLSTGERIVKKQYLQELLEKSSSGWQLESRLNLFMHENKRQVFWVPSSGINTHWKWGLNTDLKYHKKKMADIYSIGLINLIKLFLFFRVKKYV